MGESRRTGFAKFFTPAGPVEVIIGERTAGSGVGKGTRAMGPELSKIAVFGNGSGSAARPPGHRKKRGIFEKPPNRGGDMGLASRK